MAELVRCIRCGWLWDDDNPDDEVCACLHDTGHRTVEVCSGPTCATNARTMTLRFGGTGTKQEEP